MFLLIFPSIWLFNFTQHTSYNKLGKTATIKLEMYMNINLSSIEFFWSTIHAGRAIPKLVAGSEQMEIIK